MSWIVHHDTPTTPEERKRQREYHREYARKRRAEDPEFKARRNANNRRHMAKKRRETREEVLDLLGGVCEICTSSEDLEIDHRHGGGAKLRGDDANAHTRQIHKDLLRGRNSFHVRVLCHECHVREGVVLRSTE